MTSIFKKTIFLSITLIILLVPFLVSAQNPIPGGNTTVGLRIDNPFRCTGNECTLMGLIRAILNNIIMPIAAVAVTLWIVWAGFGFLTAQGNPAKLEVARRRLLWALIGAGILLGAAGISLVVQNTVGALIRP